MTASDLQRIERQLGAALPADYKAIMESYPFVPDSYVAECMLPDSADILLELAGGCDALPPHSFIIGTDCGEETYFIDTSRSASPVYVFQIETGRVSVKAPNFSAYLEKCKHADEEVRRDQQQMAQKKWWQIWR